MVGQEWICIISQKVSVTVFVLFLSGPLEQEARQRRVENSRAVCKLRPASTAEKGGRVRPGLKGRSVTEEWIAPGLGGGIKANLKGSRNVRKNRSRA